MTNTSPVPRTEPVPERYRRVWRRTLLQTPDARDTTTIVYWMQTSRWHADIRVPAGRPDFSGVRSLQDCSPAQLQWLATQQGFAGVTAVKASPQRETCAWHRVVDFQPPSATPDAGYMEFMPDKLVETGVHADYLEDWLALPDSAQGSAALLRQVRRGEPLELILIAGKCLMQVRSRREGWPAGGGWQGGASDVALLDFEISFCERRGRGWQVLHSTLPWLEGKPLALRMGERDGELLTLYAGTRRSKWQVLEWNPPGQGASACW